MTKLLLRIEEAAEALSLGRSKTYELIKADQLPVIRLGRSVRVPAAALEKWVADRASIPAAEEAVGDA